MLVDRCAVLGGAGTGRPPLCLVFEMFQITATVLTRTVLNTTVVLLAIVVFVTLRPMLRPIVMVNKA